jgi:hypothetical protein
LGFTPNFDAYGGAIYSAGELAMTNCTLAGNFARGGDGPNGDWRRQYDHPLLNSPPGSSETASRLSDAEWGDAAGGAIFIGSGTARLSFLTLANNSLIPGVYFDTNSDGFAFGPAICVIPTNAVTLTGSILTGNGSAQIFGPLLQESYNLYDAPEPGPSSGGNDETVVFGDPLLGELGTYRGFAPVLPIRLGSPAIDRVPPALSPANDGRRKPRPFNGLSDIGAFEFSNDSIPPASLTISMASKSEALVLIEHDPIDTNATFVVQTSEDTVHWTDSLTNDFDAQGQSTLPLPITGHAEQFLRLRIP